MDKAIMAIPTGDGEDAIVLTAAKLACRFSRADDASACRANEDARTYLERYGVHEIVTRQAKGRDIPGSFIDAARSGACELLVAGGYSRSGLYELVLGGAAREFVNADGLPHVLFAD
jgi:nucleotide-binding universal stress UspA family protein